MLYGWMDERAGRGSKHSIKSVHKSIQVHIPIQYLREQQFVVTQGNRTARVAVILRRGLLALHDTLEVMCDHRCHGGDGS